MPTAEEYKALGNKAFTSGNYEEAVKQFTLAIEADGTNHVLYSNRSGAYAGLRKYDEALQDAEKTVSLKSDWPKGYGRKGAALHGLKKFEEAKAAYEEGLKIDPNNAQLTKGLSEVEEILAEANSPFDNLFKGDVVSKIAANPQLSPYLSQPDFMAKVLEIQKDPSALSKHMGDQRIMTLAMSLMGLDPSILSKVGEQGGEEESAPEPYVETKPAQKAPEKKEEKVQEEPMEVEPTEEDKAKVEALKEKDLGNAAYKKKDFKAALEHYEKAISLAPAEITFYNNKAAVYFEMGNFEECIKLAEQAVDVGRENRADYKLVARSFNRMGTAYHKLGDLENSIKFYNKSLMEYRTADTLNKLKAVEKELKIKTETEYLDDEKAEEARARGNDLFKQGKFPEAIKEYTEAVKRNPKDPRAYSNRAACYTKLMALPEALKDANKCIELDEFFVKAYLRKAAIEFIKRDYAECMEICELASEKDVDKKHTAEIQQQLAKCYSAIRENNNTTKPEEALKKAQSDPELQRIIADPAMQAILQQMQTDPRAVQEHLKNPVVAKNLRKLMAAGIVRMG
ncbi:Heat shock protein sti1-like protein [Zancudomyces culisetae]|uniref:Heat shock protein sti1-like protein n=1 Tax=Zancudomyces culisetae TaxID=1213189 RepID=A0A1R1PF99_ZANCU|nr:Heat shock protein sti1-like protein [Zancudomyces culisetae]|eukprot:OMH79542.1 Heat shock protein sti1-like protein [Zancudomyces culisetae]